jgi:hypothetical protein
MRALTRTAAVKLGRFFSGHRRLGLDGREHGARPLTDTTDTRPIKVLRREARGPSRVRTASQRRRQSAVKIAGTGMTGHAATAPRVVANTSWAYAAPWVGKR